MRIVSLLPSATEMICALGLDDQLVGVTHECDFPPFVRRLPKVTRTLIPPTPPAPKSIAWFGSGCGRIAPCTRSTCPCWRRCVPT